MVSEHDIADRLVSTVDVAALARQITAAMPELQLRLHEAAQAALASQVEAALAPALAEFARALARSVDSEALRGVAERLGSALEHSGFLQALERGSYRARLYELAASHHGFVTVEMAQLAGVPPVEVRKIASRGGLDNVARGLYRASGVDGGERAPFAEAVLRVGDTAHLHGDAVLAFHNLAFVNPTRIKVGIDRRVRRELPAYIEVVHTSTPEEDITEYDGVRSTTVERALRDAVGSVMPGRLAEATQKAVNEGLIRRRPAAALLAEIGVSA